MNMVLTAPSLTAYRQPHRIEPMAGPNGLQYCRHDGLRIYTVMVPGHWLHDQASIRKLREAEMLAALNGETAPAASECVACHRPLPKGSEDEFLAILIADKGRLGLVCSYCTDRVADE